MYPESRICPHWLWDQLIKVSPDELRGWDIFRGHFLSHLESFTRRRFKTFTLLRDPVQRTISHYCHVRRSPDHPFHAHAVQLTMKDFCRHPSTRHMVVNYQCSYLAKVAFDPVRAVRQIGPAGLERFELQELLQQPDPFYGPVLLTRAKQRLATFTAFGFTETFDKSLLHLARLLGCPAPPHMTPENINPERITCADLDPETLRVIADATQLDAELYAWAKSIRLCSEVNISADDLCETAVRQY